jgi:hypothetical protein
MRQNPNRGDPGTAARSLGSEPAQSTGLPPGTSGAGSAPRAGVSASLTVGQTIYLANGRVG